MNARNFTANVAALDTALDYVGAVAAYEPDTRRDTIRRKDNGDAVAYFARVPSGRFGDCWVRLEYATGYSGDTGTLDVEHPAFCSTVAAFVRLAIHEHEETAARVAEFDARLHATGQDLLDFLLNPGNEPVDLAGMEID